MPTLYRIRITRIGPEVGDLVDGGVLILFRDGAPDELAEVSVLHEEETPAGSTPVAVGATVQVGEIAARVTAVGETAWKKVRELGHVVVSFNGAEAAERPGEICAEPVDVTALKAMLEPGNIIEFRQD